MENRKRNYGENKPERGQSPYNKKEIRRSSESSPRRDNSSFGDENPRRRFNSDSEERPQRDYSSDRRNDNPRRSFNNNSEERPRRDYSSDRRNDNPRRSFNNNSEERPRRDYSSDRRNDNPRRSFNNNSEERPQRDYSSDRRNDNPRRSFNNNSEDRPQRDYSSDRRNDNPRRSFNNNSEDRPQRDYSSDRRNDSPRRSFNNNSEERPQRDFGEKRPRKDFRESRYGFSRKDSSNREFSDRKRYNDERPVRRRDHDDSRRERGNSNGYDEISLGMDGLIRLNKYISNSGICSRREADELIKAGAVTVNGEVVSEMGHKVSADDVIVYGGERLVNERKKYLLLNKPKGYITTMDDPRDRKTVLALIGKACKERLYPVGRLDRNTTGLLLFTNDGEMTKKLTHPSFGAKKIYHVELDKPLTHADLQTILEGIELEDGMINADDIQYVGDGEDKRIVGIELHSGKNRIVRRIFAALGYEVYKLDRVAFASLTKKNLPRGMYRFLSDKEVSFLKMLKTN